MFRRSAPNCCHGKLGLEVPGYCAWRDPARVFGPPRFRPAPAFLWEARRRFVEAFPLGGALALCSSESGSGASLGAQDDSAAFPAWRDCAGRGRRQGWSVAIRFCLVWPSGLVRPVRDWVGRSRLGCGSVQGRWKDGCIREGASGCAEQGFAVGQVWFTLAYWAWMVPVHGE